MEKLVFYVSDCCGVESDKDTEICSRCGEHCEILTDDSMEKALEEHNNMTMEEYASLADYIPGLDDGEGI
jgi:predicted amidophosphoribosyltransferase